MELTGRQREVKDRLDQGMGAREIAEDLKISRNAVYQHIQKLRRIGALEPGYTPSGLPAREQPTAFAAPSGEAVGGRLQAERDRLRQMASDLRASAERLEAIARGLA